MAGDFAPLAHLYPFLYFDKRADLHFVPDFTPVKIDKTKDANACPKFHVGRDLLIKVAHGIAAGETCPTSAVTILDCPFEWILAGSKPTATATPLRLSEADAASNTFTTFKPSRPLLTGVAPFSMHSRKC